MPVTMAGVLPDVADKLLASGLHWTPSGRMYGHTLLGATLSTIVVRKIWGPRVALAWALGYLGHLVSDAGGFVPWFYPLGAYDFSESELGMFDLVRRLIRSPAAMGVELALIVWSVWALATRSRGRGHAMSTAIILQDTSEKENTHD